MKNNNSNKNAVLITLIIVSALGGSSETYSDDRPLLQKITEDVTVPIVNTITRPIVNQIGNTFIKNAELDREFRPRYKNPIECKKAKDMETIQKCADHYRNARAHFAEQQEKNRIYNEKAITQARDGSENFKSIYKKPEECYNIKNQATRVKCANEYMRARAAFEMSKK